MTVTRRDPGVRTMDHGRAREPEILEVRCDAPGCSNLGEPDDFYSLDPDYCSKQCEKLARLADAIRAVLKREDYRYMAPSTLANKIALDVAYELDLEGEEE
ncbi:MAG: hypothetical protein VW405_02600 [Rhodospirillaceae bacterium]